MGTVLKSVDRSNSRSFLRHAAVNRFDLRAVIYNLRAIIRTHTESIKRTDFGADKETVSSSYASSYLFAFVQTYSLSQLEAVREAKQSAQLCPIVSTLDRALFKIIDGTIAWALVIANRNSSIRARE